MFNIENMKGNTERELESINMRQYLPVSDATQTAIREATEADATLRQLKTIIRQGWPASTEEVSENVRDNFSFREELSIQTWTCLQRGKTNYSCKYERQYAS